MATFHITSPDGRTFEVTAPDDASQDDVLAYAQKNMGPAAPSPQDALPPQTTRAPDGRVLAAQPAVGTDKTDWSDVMPRYNAMARGFANYATFGQGDKIAAAGGALTGIQGKRGDYAGNLQDQEANTRQTKQEQPVAYGTGGALGLMASPANKIVGSAVGKAIPLPVAEAGKALTWGQKAQQYGNLAMQGGVLNTLYDATLGKQENAGKDAAATGGVAAAGMVAPEGGSTLENLGKSFVKGAATVAAPMALIEGGTAIAKSVFAPLLARLAPDEEAIARIAKAAEEDGLDAGQILSKMTKRGQQGMVADVSPGLTKLAEDTAQFPGEARTTAVRELNARAGSRLATAGGAQGRIEQALQENLSSETARTTAQELLDQRSAQADQEFGKLFANPTVPRGKELDAMANNKAVKRAMASGISNEINRANAQGVQLDPSAFVVNGKPTAQAWHLAKSELDSTAYGVASGKQLLPEGESADVGSLKTLSDSIRRQLKTQVPGYEEAVDSYAGKSQALDALNLGVKAARGDARITSSMLNDMSDTEREMFRVGLADQTQYLVSKTPDGGNVVKSVFGNQNARRNLAAAFETRADFNGFRKAMAQELNFNNTYSQVLRGSQTASREAGMAEQAKEVGKALLEGAKEGGAEGAAVQGGKAAAKGIWSTVTQPEAMRSAQARYLFSRDPKVQQELIERLRGLDKGSIFGQPGTAFFPRTSIAASKTPFIFGGP